MDDKGRVLRNRRIDYAATARMYRPYFTPPRLSKKRGEILKSGRARNAAISNFAKFFDGQSKSGRAPIMVNANSVRLAKAYGVETPGGAKMTFLPRKFAGKRISFEGNIPVIRSGNTTTRVYFIDFLDDDFLEGAADLEEGDTTDLFDYLEDAARKFVRSIPKRQGEMLTVAMATGDYLAGSDFEREALVLRLANLMLSFIKSKGIDNLAQFVTAVNQIVVAKRKPTKKGAKRNVR
jgi:hypothetical protein